MHNAKMTQKMLAGIPENIFIKYVHFTTMGLKTELSAFPVYWSMLPPRCNSCLIPLLSSSSAVQIHATNLLWPATDDRVGSTVFGNRHGCRTLRTLEILHTAAVIESVRSTARFLAPLAVGGTFSAADDLKRPLSCSTVRKARATQVVATRSATFEGHSCVNLGCIIAKRTLH